MSYNADLQTKNARIQALISKANEFPAVETTIDDVSKKIIDRTITSASDSTVTKIRDYAFAYAKSLYRADFPECMNIGQNAFYSCSRLSQVEIPTCKQIGSYAFYSCNYLTTVRFPACESIFNNAFRQCDYIKNIIFPQCKIIGEEAFLGCVDIPVASFPMATVISNFAFFGCYKFSLLTLRSSSMCLLKNSNAFSSTPFAGYSTVFSGTPYIYVPASLVSQYQSATNWAYFSSYFRSIESLGGIITFSIDGIEYQAEDGMTWAEWVDSEYNTNGFVNDEGFISSPSDGMGAWVIDVEFLSSSRYCYIFEDDLIILGYDYYTEDPWW